MFKHVSRAGHVFACVGTYQVLSVSVCVCTCYDLRVLACIQRWLCIFVCWLVTKAGHVFSCVSHIRSLSVVCTHQKLDTDVFSLIFTHPKLSECAPACVGQYPKLGVYVDIIKLACIKRQACVCVRLHVLKLGTHLHLWRAGHVWVCMCYWGEGLAHYYQLHRSKNNTMVKSHSRALLLQQQEEAKELINVSLSLSRLPGQSIWFGFHIMSRKPSCCSMWPQEAFHSEVLKEHRHILPYRFA